MKQKVLYFLLAFFLIGAQANLQAQNKNNKAGNLTAKERIEKQTSHVVNSLLLDDATAAKFSVVYTKYLNELYGSVRRDCRLSFGNRQNREKLTDAQIEKMLQGHFDRCRQILNIREKYYKEFRKILSPRQIMKVYSIEKSNGTRMNSELNKRRGTGKKKN